MTLCLLPYMDTVFPIGYELHRLNPHFCELNYLKSCYKMAVFPSQRLSTITLIEYNIISFLHLFLQSFNSHFIRVTVLLPLDIMITECFKV
jgi:hypothetical protein